MRLCRLSLAIIFFATAGVLNAQQQLTGYWEGKLPGNPPNRIVMEINQSENKADKVVLFSIDQDGDPWVPDSVVHTGTNFALVLDSGRVTYRGTLSADANSIDGVWNESGFPARTLNFTRTPRQTSWNITIPSERDITVITDARQMIASPVKWNRHDTDAHHCDAHSTTFTLYCALELSQERVFGTFKHRDSAMQEARFLIESDFENGQHYTHRLLDFNNDQNVSFADLQHFFDLLEVRINGQIKDIDAADQAATMR
jgi:hypothetical protein